MEKNEKQSESKSKCKPKWKQLFQESLVQFVVLLLFDNATKSFCPALSAVLLGSPFLVQPKFYCD